MAFSYFPLAYCTTQGHISRPTKQGTPGDLADWLLHWIFAAISQTALLHTLLRMRDAFKHVAIFFGQPIQWIETRYLEVTRGTWQIVNVPQPGAKKGGSKNWCVWPTV
jgi:hypothetical protein